MTVAEFWDHIRATRRVDADAHAERLVKRLAKLSEAKILAFDHLWHRMLHRAYRWNLWGAAYLIHGGCSDDGFDYFRRWLVLRGREAFEAAVKRPDALADVVTDDDFTEVYGDPGLDAWFAATGRKKTDAGYAAYDAAFRARYGEPKVLPDLGDDWDLEDHDQLRRRLPRLAARYLDGDD
jgi:hypothetical protein